MRMRGIRRREFLTLFGSVAGWPITARAQQRERMRRVGVLLTTAADDPESAHRLLALGQGLQQAGWIDGRNLRIDIRWSNGNADLSRKYAMELMALAPDVVLASGTNTVVALQQVSRTVPIVFVGVTDPVAF